MSELQGLLERAQACELCGGTDELSAYAVAPRSDAVLVCGTCSAQLAGEVLDEKHWYCLQEAAWSAEPAVQVLAFRLLGRLNGAWAADLQSQLYLDEDASGWAASTGAVRTLDSNGTELRDGDSVTLIRDLDVKGANFTAKRGTLVKNIRTGEDPELVEGRVNKVAIYLKTCFLRKA